MPAISQMVELIFNLLLLRIQNITVAEHDGHSDSFQVKFPNIFTHYPNDAVRVEDEKFKDWDHYKFTLWQSQLNFGVFCASSACGVSVEHLNAKEPMIRSVYRFHVYYHIRRILNRLEIPLPYENSFNKYNNPYNHEKFKKFAKNMELVMKMKVVMNIKLVMKKKIVVI